MKDYKREAWATGVVFTLLSLTGGFISIFFVLGKDAFFGPAPQFTPHSSLFGLPLHYVLLIMGSWLGATLLGAIWTLVLDGIDKREN